MVEIKHRDGGFGWLLLLFGVFVFRYINEWQSYGSASDNWLPQGLWISYSSNIIMIGIGAWLARRAYYRGGRVFWTIQIIVHIAFTVNMSGVLSQPAFSIDLNIRLF